MTESTATTGGSTDVAVTLQVNGPFVAQFAEVRIDPELGLLRIARIVSTVDAGRILNEKTARSQIIGATVMGIGMTTLEKTVFDSAGRVANATFADYLIPVNADAVYHATGRRIRSLPITIDQLL